ncbi:MAG: outer membrane lipoprotein carrier protein LolA [Treponema sp.]|nr:outer membrane lipoprotein carrier protein LolA [Treponema sp.]
MKTVSGKRIPFFYFAVTVIFLVTSVREIKAQDIITADSYLQTVSDNYANVKDYEAGVVIRSGTTDMTGQLSFLNPSFLRIDFTRPAEQVICFNGDLLTIYLPDYKIVLNQEITTQRSTAGGAATGASLASSQGLSLLRKNYIPSFVTGPDPVPIDDGSKEMVVKLRLTRRSISEGYREIVLSISPDTLLIRRIEGRTIADALVRFDFSNIRTNLGIPPGRFIYDSPASANVVNNFLFRDTE